MNLKHALIVAASMLASAHAERVQTATAPTYPLDVCVVSGEKLGSMGENYVFEHNGQQVQLCCKGCLKKFNNAPEKYMSKIAAAAKSKETPAPSAPK